MSNPDARGLDDHKVEDHAKVYLCHTPDGWVIDRTTLDGHPLFGLDGGAECDINHHAGVVTAEERAAWEAEHDAAVETDLPTAYELTLLLIEALRNTGAPIHLIGHCGVCGGLVTEDWMRSADWQASGYCGPCLNGIGR